MTKKPLTHEVRLFVIEHVLSGFTNDYVCKAIKAWREKGFKSPAAAAKVAVGQGGFGCPAVHCPLNISVSADNFSGKINGFQVKTGDGQEGIVTYREIAEVALRGKMEEQITIFEVAT